MTRENKLAMVVGFGLLLFVGILVSDHFSTAQRQGSANLATNEPRVTRTISIAPAAGATMVQVPEAISRTTFGDARPVSNGTNVRQGVHNENPNIQPIPNAPTPAAEIVIATAPISKAAKVEVQESEPGVQLHPIAQGETLYSICLKQYGDGSLWPQLAEYNKKALPNATKLRKGVTLRLPPVQQLRQGAVVASTVKGARVSVTPQEQEGASLRNNMGSTFNNQVPLLAAADIASIEMEPIKSGVIEVVDSKSKPVTVKSETQARDKSNTETMYVVQKGDTLGSIAKNKLGKSSRWREIAAVNKTTLSNPAALSPGMNIQIPQTN